MEKYNKILFVIEFSCYYDLYINHGSSNNLLLVGWSTSRLEIRKTYTTGSSQTTGNNFLLTDRLTNRYTFV